MIRQTYHIDHPDGTIEIRLSKCCEEDNDEPTVEILDPWGNKCDIPVSAVTEVQACMQEVVEEHLGRAKQ